MRKSGILPQELVHAYAANAWVRRPEEWIVVVRQMPGVHDEDVAPWQMDVLGQNTLHAFWPSVIEQQERALFKHRLPLAPDWAQ